VLCSTLTVEVTVTGTLPESVFAVVWISKVPGALSATKAICSPKMSGAALLRRYGDFARGVEIVLHHHEAWDGSGYPGGLRGSDIPFGSRVIAVADGYDAMTSDRPYRRGMTHEQAVSILCAGRGNQWDAALVDAFLAGVAEQAAAPAAPALRALEGAVGFG
jgi:HD-GYP domain-containing protein (c-di-GMP phosphodiesterase class II)